MTSMIFWMRTIGLKLNEYHFIGIDRLRSAIPIAINEHPIKTTHSHKAKARQKTAVGVMGHCLSVEKSSIRPELESSEETQC